MEPSPAPHESPGKVAAKDEPVAPGSLSRFKRLTRHLFGVDREAFQDALKKDEEERRAKRGR
jgi:hypothetical protein